MEKTLLSRLEELLTRIEPFLPPKTTSIDWEKNIAALWNRHPWFGGQLIAIAARDQLKLNDLIGIDRQKSELVKNTEAFLAKKPANHALLWGARGTGKSSLIRALLNHFHPKGLRLIQMDRYDLVGLPVLVAQLADLPQRFIIYCDDLSFEAHDDAYKALKSVLDGALTGPPNNVLIYATSNRRHLLPEAASDNKDSQIINDELHHGDAVEEKISLSDRFGLWLSFYAFNQKTYLETCRFWLAYWNVQWSDEAEQSALHYALLRGVRSGRAAWQFACYFAGSLTQENEETPPFL